jgi:hypothetical protein
MVIRGRKKFREEDIVCRCTNAPYAKGFEEGRLGAVFHFKRLYHRIDLRILKEALESGAVLAKWLDMF